VQVSPNIQNFVENKEGNINGMLAVCVILYYPIKEDLVFFHTVFENILSNTFPVNPTTLIFL